jgi:hypothetical protein
VVSPYGPAGQDICGHVHHPAARGPGGRAQQLESCLGGEISALDEDPFGPLDHGPSVKRTL